MSGDLEKGGNLEENSFAGSEELEIDEDADADFKPLPASVQRRVKALKKLQLESTELEAKFYDEVYKLEVKYLGLNMPLFEARSKIVSGEHEPNDEECDWPSDSEQDEQEEKQTAIDVEKDLTKGIPEFWLTVFKNVELVSAMIQEYDEPILQKLKDLKISMDEKNMSFMVHFFFDPNDYFSNTVLTKTYFMKIELDKDYPLDFEGPEIFKCIGCKIDWKEGKNVTVKYIKKKQKHKSKGEVRSLTVMKRNESFFNFFSPPEIPDDLEAEVDEQTQIMLTTDFEIGHFIREKIIPKAVLYFTGEACEVYDEDEEEEDEEDDEEGDEEEEEEEDDEDDDPLN